jgi:hypothetical protein
MAHSGNPGFDLGAIQGALHRIKVTHLARIYSNHYRSDPVGFDARSSSRFSDPAQRYGVIYGSTDLGCAFWEAVIRDRYRDKPIVEIKEIEARVASFFKADDLNVVQLDLDSIKKMRAHRNVIGGDQQVHGRLLSAFVHENLDSADGFQYRSTFTGRWCFAIFGRAIGKLIHQRTNALIQQPEILEICHTFNIEVIDR